MTFCGLQVFQLFPSLDACSVSAVMFGLAQDQFCSVLRLCCTNEIPLLQVCRIFREVVPDFVQLSLVQHTERFVIKMSGVVTAYSLCWTFLNGPPNSQKSTSIPPRGGNSRTPVGFSSMKDRILLEFEGICHVNPAFCFGIQLSFSYC